MLLSNLNLKLPRVAAGGAGDRFIAESFEVGSGAYTLHMSPPCIKKGDIIYGAPILSDGSQYIRAFSLDVTTGFTDFDFLRTSAQDDDHNNATPILINGGAQLGVISTDHNNGANVWFYRSTDDTVANLSLAATWGGFGNPSYSHAFTNPGDLDQIDMLIRQNSSASSNWRISRCENATAGTPTITTYNLFDEIYVKMDNEANGGSGLWFIAAGIPDVQGTHQDSVKVQGQAIALWYVDRDTDSLYSGGPNGTLEEADFKTGLSGAAINPLGRNRLLYSDRIYSDATITGGNTTTGTQLRHEGASGTCRRLFATAGGGGTKRYRKPWYGTVTTDDWVVRDQAIRCRRHHVLPPLD